MAKVNVNETKCYDITKQLEIISLQGKTQMYVSQKTDVKPLDRVNVSDKLASTWRNEATAVRIAKLNQRKLRSIENDEIQMTIQNPK